MKHCWHPFWDKQHPSLRSQGPIISPVREFCCWCGKERDVDYDLSTSLRVSVHGPHTFECVQTHNVRPTVTSIPHQLDDEECPERKDQRHGIDG